MSAGSPPQATTERPTFAVERFTWAGVDRLEVTGRWSGVRGRRFMRPTLDVHGAGDQRRLLAVLDHKPWAAEDGASWTAAFPWDGGTVALSGAELAVAPGVAVTLGAPGHTARGATATAPAPAAPAPDAAAPAPAPPEDRALRRELEAARADRERALRRIDDLRAERDALSAQVDASHRERDALTVQLDAAHREREALAAQTADAPPAGDPAPEHDTLAAQLDAAHREREAVEGRLDAATGERAVLERRLGAATREREAAAERLDAALRERDDLAARLGATERGTARRTDGTTQLDVLLGRVLAAGAIGSFVVLVVLVLVAAL